MDPAGRLEEIAAQVRVCVRCRLHKSRTHAVPGEGPSDAPIVFVGEAPGRTEDAEGRPFVGPAGRVLDAALRSAGLTRNSVFITNVVKCRPPANRPPRKDEIESCLPYLRGQIETLRPGLIITLGETALRALVPTDASFADLRGKHLSFGGVRVIATYHPAAVLYNRRLEDVLRADLRRAADARRREPERPKSSSDRSVARSAVSSGTVVLDRTGRVLLLHVAKGRWCLPKGGVERGETVKQAAIRETLEETGLRVRLDGRLTTIRYTFRSPIEPGRIHKRVTYFLAAPVGGKVRLEPGFDRYLWATKAQALRLVHYANDREVLHRAFDRFGSAQIRKRSPGRAPAARH